MVLKKILFSFALFIGFEMFSSEQECRDLLDQLIFDDCRYRPVTDQKKAELKRLLLLYPQVACSTVANRALPLSDAARCGIVWLVKILLEAGADHDAVCRHYDSPLLASVIVFRRIRSSSEDPKIVDHRKYMVKFLLKYGANPDQHQPSNFYGFYTSSRKIMPNLIAEIERELADEEKDEASALTELLEGRGQLLDAKFTNEMASMLQLSSLRRVQD